MILTISPSSIETFQECPTKYNFGSIRRLSAVDKDLTKLNRGRFFHELLQLHYTLLKEGIETNEIILNVTNTAREKYTTEDWDFNLVEECIKNYQEYAIFYANDGWEIVAIESPFSIEIYSGIREYEYSVNIPPERIVDNKEIKIILEGRIDLIVKNNGLIYPVDHKTSDKQEKPNVLSNQFMAYAFATNSFNIVKNEIGFQKTYGPNQRFHRHVISYDEANLIEWKNQVIEDGLEIIRMLDEGNWPKRFSSCWRCEFKRICESSPAAREFKIEGFYKVRPEYDIYS